MRFLYIAIGFILLACSCQKARQTPVNKLAPVNSSVWTAFEEAHWSDISIENMRGSRSYEVTALDLSRSVQARSTILAYVRRSDGKVYTLPAKVMTNLHIANTDFATRPGDKLVISCSNTYDDTDPGYFEADAYFRYIIINDATSYSVVKDPREMSYEEVLSTFKILDK